MLAADPAVIRGTYSDWGVVLQSAKYVDYDVTRSTERRIDSMAATNVNVIWWTNLPDDPARLAHVVRYSRSRGIESVLGSGRWYAYTGRSAEQSARLRSLHDALPVDARPWRWSIGDETTPDALTDLRAMADACIAANIPTAMVQVPEYHQQTLTTIGNRIPLVSCDIYPFFVTGLPSNPPYGPAALTLAKSRYADVVARSRSAGVTPLVMVQAFGDASLFAMPSPGRPRWQIWSAVAAGSPGTVVFAHGVPWTLPGGQPASLVDLPTETLTPQGIAVRDTFARIKTIETLLAGSTPQPAPAWASTVQAGDWAAILRTATGRRLLLIVADPDQPTRTLKVTLPGVTRVSPLASSTGGTLQVLPWPWRLVWPGIFSATLQPGDCWIGEVW
jgi:hypothetical protein